MCKNSHSFVYKFIVNSGPTTRIWKKGGIESFQKCSPPWLGDEENFEIYKL